MYLKKSEVDKACKDKLHATFDKDFSVNVRFTPALARQSPLPTLDSLPNRTILLKYNSHNGPNSVQVSAPSYSTIRSSPGRNKPALSMFGTEGTANSTPSEPSDDGQESTISSPSSIGTASSGQQPNGKAAHGPMLVHCGKAAFRPAWSNKDRDWDDNWDASSVSSDCSELDTHSEWWYTRPPRPSTVSSAVMAAGTASVTFAQPDQPLDEKKELKYELPPLSFASALSRTGLPAPNALGTRISPPNSAKKSPPHSASSPLAREFRFESESGTLLEETSSSCCCTTDKEAEVPSPQRDRRASRRGSYWERDSLGGAYFDEEGLPIAGSGAGIGHERGGSKDGERGWIDSVSRWFWYADEQKELAPNEADKGTL